MKHRLPWLFGFLLIAPLLVAACNGEAGPLDPTPAIGEYTLYEINGVRPPLVVGQDVNGRVEVVGGSLVLRGDRSYTETADLRIVPPSGSASAPQTNTVSGSFQLKARGGAQRVEFRTRDGNLFFGTLVGDTLAYAMGSFNVTYVK